jgi:hypothetical protein
MKEIKAIQKVIKTNQKGIFILKRNLGMGMLNSILEADPKSIVFDSSYIEERDVDKVFKLSKKHKTIVFDGFNDMGNKSKKLINSKLDELTNSTVILIG